VPELPEVETVKNSLNRRVKNRTIDSVDIHYAPIVRGDLEAFKRALPGRTIDAVTRRGKYLIFHLGKRRLISHLRMEGKYFLKPFEAPVEKHEHIVFNFKDGESLRYHDVRKFGTMDIKHKDRCLTTPPLVNLGVEPDDQAFTPEYLRSKLDKTERAIKTALLDQTIVAGIGNIYADEILYCAGLNPQRRGKTLTQKDWQNLVYCTKMTLDKAIALGGSSIRTYSDSLGITGRFQNELNVHMQKDRPCPSCGNPIIKTKVNGRGTYLCPRCQKE